MAETQIIPYFVLKNGHLYRFEPLMPPDRHIRPLTEETFERLAAEFEIEKVYGK